MGRSSAALLFARRSVAAETGSPDANFKLGCCRGRKFRREFQVGCHVCERRRCSEGPEAGSEVHLHCCMCNLPSYQLGSMTEFHPTIKHLRDKRCTYVCMCGCKGGMNTSQRTVCPKQCAICHKGNTSCLAICVYARICT